MEMINICPRMKPWYNFHVILFVVLSRLVPTFASVDETLKFEPSMKGIEQHSQLKSKLEQEIPIPMFISPDYSTVDQYYSVGGDMALMMTSAEVVETSVNVINNSPSRDYFHPDDQTT